MTLLTLLAECAAMDVSRPMACCTVLRKFLPGDGRGMAAVTGDLRMLARQIPMSILCMVERGGLPLLGPVALFATSSQSSTVSVLSLVATRALAGKFVLEISGPVAILAVDAPV